MSQYPLRRVKQDNTIFPHETGATIRGSGAASGPDNRRASSFEHISTRHDERTKRYFVPASLLDSLTPSA